MSSNPSLGYFKALIQKTKTLRKENKIIQTNNYIHSIHFFNPPLTLELSMEGKSTRVLKTSELAAFLL